MSIKSKRVLLIDDDEDHLKIIKTILETAGYHVTVTEMAEDALDICKKDPPHLIITDLKMMPMSGFEFLEKYMQSNVPIKAPVIVLSSLKDKLSVFKAISLGASDYLVKPIQTMQLLKKVKKHIRTDEFLEITYGEVSSPKIDVHIPGTIISVGETGFKIEVPVRLATESMVKLKSTIIDELEATSLPMKTSPVLAKTSDTGQYINEVRFIGITYEMSIKIRKLIKRWS